MALLIRTITKTRMLQQLLLVAVAPFSLLASRGCKTRAGSRGLQEVGASDQSTELLILPILLSTAYAESQKPRQRVSNADWKVFANPESFATSSLLAEEYPDTLQYKISR